MRNWQQKKLGELLIQRKEQVVINPDTKYLLVTISNNGDIRLREKRKGAVISAKKGYIAKAGDFIYSRLSVHTGAFGIVPQELDNALITSEMPCFEIDKNQIHPKILLDLIRLPNSLWQLKQLTKGMGRVRIKENMILSLSLVLPPSAEQGKLVGKIDRIKNNQSSLRTELTHQKNLLKKLRQQILQEAVEGKLTAGWRQQNPAVEPASELLKRIQAEKQQLIKDKKIKNQKPLTPVNKEEQPFDLPDGWEWCRLRDIAMINPRNAVDDDLDVGFTPMHLVSSNWCEHPKHELRKWGSVKKGFTHFANADVVVAKITPCFENSKAGIIKDFPSGIGAGTTELHVVRRLTGDISPRYLYLLLKTSKFLENGKKLMKGAVGQKRVPKDYLENLILSLPPLPEQKAIVTRVEKLLTLCDRLETQITSNQNHAEQLMQAVLKEAFGATDN